jgi:phosphoribosylformylglycinamidine synthase
MKVRVDVMLKNGVLDPQGKAIGHALGNLGFSGIGDVRAGKVIELDLAETDKTKAIETAKLMAEKLLANLVIEDFKVSLIQNA